MNQPEHGFADYPWNLEKTAMRFTFLPTTRRTLLQRGLQATGALGLGLFTGQGVGNQTLAATPGKKKRSYRSYRG